MKKTTLFAALTLAVATFTGCVNEIETTTTGDSPNANNEQITTRAYGDKTPLFMVYVETNDINPLIAGGYTFTNTAGTQMAMIDICNLFASNIHIDDSGNPTLYFNVELTPIMASPSTYIAPLQARGIKVLLSVLGDWTGKGVANLTIPSQIESFANILCYVVDHYGLDGICFDDEYANYSSFVSGSYGTLIEALRAKLDANFSTHKLITVFDFGYTSQISAAQGALIDYADYAALSPSSFSSSSSIAGITTDRWMPVSINLGTVTSTYLSTIRTRAGQVRTGGYAGFMAFNLRCNSSLQLSVLESIADGLYNTSTSTTNVTFDSNNGQYTCTKPTPAAAGATITSTTAGAWLPVFTN